MIFQKVLRNLLLPSNFKRIRNFLLSDTAYFLKDKINPLLNEKNAAEFMVAGYVRSRHRTTYSQVSNQCLDFQGHYQQSVSYTHLRAHETPEHLVCRLLLEKKKK